MNEPVEIAPGVKLRHAAGVDIDALATSFLVLQDKMPARIFARIVSEYNFCLNKCQKCEATFTTDYNVDTLDIPHWYRAKFTRSPRGRPPGPILDEVWPNGKSKYALQMCLDCAYSYIPGILEHFDTLTNATQVRALRTLSDTASAYSKKWEGNKIFYRFFTKLTQELIPHVRKRGKKQVHYLTSMMVSCNLIPKEE
jgi:hypothetical protein